MGTKARILVVEDEGFIATDICQTLTRLTYDVTSVASSGERAVEQASATRPDLILMDIKLAGKMDGIEAAGQIRAQHDIPIVYLTAHSDASLVERAKPTEPYGYLVKPFRENELRTTIEIALHKHKMDHLLKETNRQLDQEIRGRKQAQDALHRSLEETSRSRRTVLALSQAAQGVHRARTPEGIYRAVGDELAGLGYLATVLTLTEDRSNLAVAHLSFEPALLRAADSLPGFSLQDLSFGLAPDSFFQSIIDGEETTFTERTSEQFAKSLSKVLRPLASRLARLLGTERSIIAPLMVDGDVVGLLVVAGESLTQADVPAVAAFADQAAIAIENAHLYEQAREDTETRATLLREVNHRVKNNLTGIIGLLYAARSHAKVEDQATYRAAMRELIGRVQGLATVHKMLSAVGWTSLRLSDLAGRVIRAAVHAVPSDKRVSVDVPASTVHVTPGQAHNLALVINELATNAVKYALEGSDAARITFRITADGDTVRCEFRDSGPGYPKDVLQLERCGVGFDLIQNIVRDSLRGELSLHNDGGAVAVIFFEAAAEL